ncbi:MAG: putative lipoprotein [Paenibacillus sp.]|nr:putative lipoprotein [Paenibacillus sp.]
MKRWTSWVSFLLIIALLTACGADAGRYIKDQYPLVSVDGKGSNLSKVYLVENKSVPAVSAELAAKESPKEKSKDSDDQMFLVYNDKVINVQKDPSESKNTLVQIDSIEYAKSHYDSSFLQGYLTATLLQSLFGGGWYNSKRPYDYKGYTRTPTYNTGGGKATTPTTDVSKDKKPTTSDRTGTFNGGTGTTRRNDGSTPNKVTKPSVSKPSTSKKTGSFKRR